MTSGTVHIVGAGLAGLSAAVKLAGSGREVVVHELARYAGGRCRSYFEPALGLNIDNGNHLLLSANRSALALLKAIGSEDKLVPVDQSKRLGEKLRNAGVFAEVNVLEGEGHGFTDAANQKAMRRMLDFLDAHLKR